VEGGAILPQKHRFFPGNEAFYFDQMNIAPGQKGKTPNLFVPRGLAF
jgi:hypothetical protein